jgi:hypothetical protein
MRANRKMIIGNMTVAPRLSNKALIALRRDSIVTSKKNKKTKKVREGKDCLLF